MHLSSQPSPLPNTWLQSLRLRSEGVRRRSSKVARPVILRWHSSEQTEWTFPISNSVSVHGTLKLEIGNWKFGFHAFVLFRMIVLSDSPQCSEPFCSTYQSHVRPYLITLLPVCKHPTRKLASSFPNFQFQISSRSSFPNFYFLISSFKPWTATKERTINNLNKLMFFCRLLRCSSIT